MTRQEIAKVIDRATPEPAANENSDFILCEFPDGDLDQLGLTTQRKERATPASLTMRGRDRGDEHRTRSKGMQVEIGDFGIGPIVEIVENPQDAWFVRPRLAKGSAQGLATVDPPCMGTLEFGLNRDLAREAGSTGPVWTDEEYERKFPRLKVAMSAPTLLVTPDEHPASADHSSPLACFSAVQVRDAIEVGLGAQAGGRVDGEQAQNHGLQGGGNTGCSQRQSRRAAEPLLDQDRSR